MQYKNLLLIHSDTHYLSDAGIILSVSHKTKIWNNAVMF